jgi:hypothetical protein
MLRLGGYWKTICKKVSIKYIQITHPLIVEKENQEKLFTAIRFS